MNKKSINTINVESFQFLSLKTARGLSNLFNMSYDTFVDTIKYASYREFTIPKSNGGKRTIEAPNEHLSLIQKRLNNFLQSVYYRIKPTTVYGFVISAEGESDPKTIITNAKNHIGKSTVLNIDLKDFFHSISAIKVRKLFQEAPFHFTEDIATGIALICCWERRLPMGAATSPVISNLICLELDKQLLLISKKYGFIYSRYADDLTFSSDHSIGEEAIGEIKKVIADNDFKVNTRKFRIQSKFRQQSVTGIKVNQKTNVDRRYIRNIRAILNDIKWNGLEKSACKHYKVKEADEKLVNTFVASLSGRINFIGDVRGRSDLIYNGFRQELKNHKVDSTIV